ncbi:unnamed protein product, partial [Didymodactylos carnosus]
CSHSGQNGSANAFLNNTKDNYTITACVFPLNPLIVGITSSPFVLLPPSQPLFAYLPLQKMIDLLPKAYEDFIKLPSRLKDANLKIRRIPNEIEVLKYFLKLIPIKNEIDPYFNTFIKHTTEILMGQVKLPVINVVKRTSESESK